MPVIPQITREICSFIVKLSLTFIILDIRKNAIKAKLILSRLKPKGLIHIEVNSLDTGMLMAKKVLAIMIKITPFTTGVDLFIKFNQLMFMLFLCSAIRTLSVSLAFSRAGII